MNGAIHSVRAVLIYTPDGVSRAGRVEVGPHPRGNWRISIDGRSGLPGLHIHDQLELCGLLVWQVARLRALQDPTGHATSSLAARGEPITAPFREPCRRQATRQTLFPPSIPRQALPSATTAGPPPGPAPAPTAVAP